MRVFKTHTSGTRFRTWKYESQQDSLENYLWDRNIKENIEHSEQKNALESGSFLEEWVEGFEDILLVKEKERIKKDIGNFAKKRKFNFPLEEIQCKSYICQNHKIGIPFSLINSPVPILFHYFVYLFSFMNF